MQPGQGSTVLVQRSTSLEVSGRGIAIGRHHTSGGQAPTPSSLAISHVTQGTPRGRSQESLGAWESGGNSLHCTAGRAVNNQLLGEFLEEVL